MNGMPPFSPRPVFAAPRPWFRPGRRAAILGAMDARALCRDCLTAFAGAGRCPACRSPRTLAHPELAGLAIAHVDADAF